MILNFANLLSVLVLCKNTWIFFFESEYFENIDVTNGDLIKISTSSPTGNLQPPKLFLKLKQKYSFHDL